MEAAHTRALLGESRMRTRWLTSLGVIAVWVRHAPTNRSRARRG